MPPNSIAYYQGDAASIIRPRKQKDPATGKVGADWTI
jgi:hypothetical protein